jgi:hypothetical protein
MTLVRPRPRPRDFWVAPLTAQHERVLVSNLHKRWHEHVELMLLHPHRPMLARMAQRFARGDRKMRDYLVECGMLGLRIKAKPPPQSHKQEEVGRL